MSKINISYGRTVFVNNVPDGILDTITQELPWWSQGDGNVCSTREDIISFLAEEKINETDLYHFVLDVTQNIEGEYGDIIFSK